MDHPDKIEEGRSSTAVWLLRSLLPVLLFIAALWLLRRELAGFRYHDVIAYLRALPLHRVGLAFVFTLCGYFALTFYDYLGTRYAGVQIPYPRTALTSFIGYAFSNAIGNSLLTSTPIRFRLYSAWGASAEQITKIIGFCFLTFWLGFLTLTGGVLAIHPSQVPDQIHFPGGLERLLGAVFLLVVAAYLAATLGGTKSLRIRGWDFRLPQPPFALAQILVSIVDWTLAAAVLYTLLPRTPGLTFPGFLGFFMIAQIAGFLSMVPGGLGVFETVLVLLIGSFVPQPQALGALLAYRGIYYVAPLVISVGLLIGTEIHRRREKIAKGWETASRWASAIVPNALAVSTFFAGATLLVSGAAPAGHRTLAGINSIVPLWIIEASHLFGSVAGAVLLVLARGLQRRLDGAWQMTVILLGGGTAMALLRGQNWVIAMLMLVLFVIVVAHRDRFDRRASLADARFSPGWVTAIAMVFAAATWLTFFAYKHVDYSNQLWWRFALDAHAPRSLRALTGAAAAMLVLGVSRLLRPAPPDPAYPDEEELDRAAVLSRAHPATYAWLSLLSDKHILFNADRTAFIMYRVQGRSWISMGDPVGPPPEARELCWVFRDLAERHNGWPVFYQVREDSLSSYVDLGLALVKLGEEARVFLPTFGLEGGSRKELRQTIRKLEAEGVTLEIVPEKDVPSILPEIRTVSDQWLAGKSVAEKGFSLGSFEPQYLVRTPIALVRQNGALKAFANIWRGGNDEMSVDLMRYTSDAPPSVMTWLFAKLMLIGREEGFRWFSLGMAPLAGIEQRAGAPLWNRIAGLVFRHGEHFYNFQGLRQYKQKFGPVWEPRYLASPGGLEIAQVLANLTTLISGGASSVFTR